MMQPSLDSRRGILLSPRALVSITAANTSTTLYSLSTNRTCFLRKVMIANRSGSNIQVRIGETVNAAFTQRLPQIQVPNGQEVILTEEEIPDFEFTSDIVAQATAAGASPNDVQVQVTVEEIGGVD